MIENARSQDPTGLAPPGLGVAQSYVTPTAEQAQRVYDAFFEIMQRASEHSEIADRLALADTVSHVHLRDSPQQLAMTLFFDRAPVEVEHGAVGHAEVELFIDTNDVLRFWTGDLHLAMGIMHGDVEFKGPVRKLLRIVPIARRLVGEFQSLAVAEGILPADGDAPPAAG